MDSVRQNDMMAGASLISSLAPRLHRTCPARYTRACAALSLRSIAHGLTLQYYLLNAFRSNETARRPLRQSKAELILLAGRSANLHLAIAAAYAGHIECCGASPFARCVFIRAPRKTCICVGICKADNLLHVSISQRRCTVKNKCNCRQEQFHGRTPGT